MAVANHIQDIDNTESVSPTTTATTKEVMSSTHPEAIGTIVTVIKGPITAETPDGDKHSLKEGDPIHLDELDHLL